MLILLSRSDDDDLFGSPKKKRKGSVPTAAELLAEDRADGDWDDAAIAAVEVCSFLSLIVCLPAGQTEASWTSALMYIIFICLVLFFSLTGARGRHTREECHTWYSY